MKIMRKIVKSGKGCNIMFNGEKIIEPNAEWRFEGSYEMTLIEFVIFKIKQTLHIATKPTFHVE